MSGGVRDDAPGAAGVSAAGARNGENISPPIDAGHRSSIGAVKRPACTFVIDRVTRRAEAGAEEALEFTPGVNVLVGPPNAGKTKWLSFIDFLLGDTGSPEDALGQDLAEKYASTSLHLRIFDAPAYGAPNTSAAGAKATPASDNNAGNSEAGAGEPHVGPGAVDVSRADEHQTPEAPAVEAPPPARPLIVERRWKEPGGRGRIFVDGQAMTAETFSLFLLHELGIPTLHVPKGDPYSPRAWPTLSWRMLFRHLYRQERFWSDLADKQPDSEQHACLTQFLGIAKALFSAQFGELVEKRKRILALEARKDAYVELLHQVTTDIGRFAELSVAVTAESVAAARARLDDERRGVVDARLDVLRALAEQVEAGRAGEERHQASAWQTYGEQLAAQRAKAESLMEEVARIDARAAELRGHHANVTAELQRLDRAQSAGEALGHLKVTHCPVCDQSVSPTRGSPTECYLCFQPYDRTSESNTQGSRRLAFEFEQLREEERELGEMISRLTGERQRIDAGVRAARDEAARLDALLRPTRVAAAAILPPELSVYDQEAGRIEEQLRTLERIERSLAQRDSLADDIDGIAAAVQALEAEVNRLTESVRFEAVGDVLADGFNSYFNALNADDPNRWPEAPVRVRLTARDFEITLGDAAWRPMLGATFACFFLNAYHYALMGLSGREGSNYPGFAMLDFPPTLADGKELTNEENYLVAPFVGLMRRLPAMTQLIVAGRAFVDLAGANRVELADVWR